MNNDDAAYLVQADPARPPFSAVLDETAVLHVSGELDISTATALLAALDQIARPGCVVSLNLAAVTFMDSSGVHVLVEAAAAVGEHGRIVLVRASQPVRRTLALAGLGGLFDHQ